MLNWTFIYVSVCGLLSCRPNLYFNGISSLAPVGYVKRRSAIVRRMSDQEIEELKALVLSDRKARRGPRGLWCRNRCRTVTGYSHWSTPPRSPAGSSPAVASEPPRLRSAETRRARS